MVDCSENKMYLHCDEMKRNKYTCTVNTHEFVVRLNCHVHHACHVH